jgi:hypothetical protein
MEYSKLLFSRVQVLQTGRNISHSLLVFVHIERVGCQFDRCSRAKSSGLAQIHKPDSELIEICSQERQFVSTSKRPECVCWIITWSLLPLAPGGLPVKSITPAPLPRQNTYSLGAHQKAQSFLDGRQVQREPMIQRLSMDASDSLKGPCIFIATRVTDFCMGRKLRLTST